MPGTNNFQIWNPSANNQESDAAYTTDTQRVNGAPSGQPFPSPTANKLFFQVSTMCAAIAYMMAQKGFNMSDANGVNLATALSNIMTTADIQLNTGGALTFNTATTGHLSFAGLILQWGNVLMPGSSSSDNPTAFNFDIAFPHACLVCVPATFSPSADRITFLKAVTASGGTMSNNGSQANATYIAIGY